MTPLQTSLTDLTITSDSIPSAAKELENLKKMPLDDLLNNIVNDAVHFAISLAVAIAVFYIGKWIIKKLHTMVSGIMLRRQVDRSLSTFVLSLLRIVLYFILIVTVIGILGIETSSFIALFASAGVAIGMALSGTLQNFAGGVLILLLKPYRIGDYIEAQGFAGTVTEIQIFSTIICTPDNKSIIIPNGGLSTGSINNWSREQYRRVEWSVGITYGDDVSVARRVLLDLIAADSRIVRHSLEEDRLRREQLENKEQPAETESDRPQPKGIFGRIFHRHRSNVRQHLDELERRQQESVRAFRPQIDYSPAVYVAALADSSVNLTVRAWVNSADYWAVYYRMNESIYTELPKHGIRFPYPQLDVHFDTPATTD